MSGAGSVDEDQEESHRMSEVATAPRLPFGTVAALFPSPQAADQAVAALVRQGYPRQLIAVYTGQPWETATTDDAGIVPDAELRFRLTPASPDDVMTAVHRATLPPALAAFAGEALTGEPRRRGSALWTLAALVVSIIATLWAIYTRDWIAITIVSLVGLNVVVAAFVLAYVRRRDVTFPFREAIPAVDEALEQGGALVTVRCTLPYTSVVEASFAQAGGEVLGYAPEIVYPALA